MLVDSILVNLEVFRGKELAHVSKLLVAKRMRKLNKQADEVSDLDPSASAWVVLHPGLHKACAVVCVYYSEVLQFCILQSFNDCSN